MFLTAFRHSTESNHGDLLIPEFISRRSHTLNLDSIGQVEFLFKFFEDGFWNCEKIKVQKARLLVGPWICQAILSLNTPIIYIPWHVHVYIIVEVHGQTDTSKLVCLLGPVLSGGGAAHRRRCEVQIRAAKKMGEPVGSTPVRSPSTQIGSDDNQRQRGQPGHWHRV